MLACLLKAPGPLSVHVTPFAEASFVTMAVIVTDRPCSIVCALLPLKLTEITGGGVLAPPPQPERGNANVRARVIRRHCGDEQVQEEGMGTSTARVKCLSGISDLDL